ncbi:MAG: response regulator [Candidatus Brocadiae bacterium]|nr:response regulator [Candidatus Brocadiia bacterium]
MNVLLQQVASLTEPKWKEQPRAKGITIEMEMNFQTIPLVMGNEADLREALTNVIFNSVDAMEKNGKIILCTELNHPYVTIKIYDTGKGMTKEIKQRCLEPFYSTKGKEGTGLGLSMVFGIVQRHEGHLEIISEENKGTCIVINLPFVAENKVEKKPEESKEIKIRPLKILVAEDDPNVREVISLYLEEEGHKSVITSDGLEALQKFPTEPFDLVITDQAMPNMSGDQLAKKIKYISPEMPIILLTGFTSFLNSDNIASYGIDFVMHKPLNRNKLQQALSKFFLAKEIS